MRAKQLQRMPVVLTQDEVQAVVRPLSGTTWMLVTWRDGSDLRRMEGLRLRVKALDVASHHIAVREGTGHTDRVTLRPLTVQGPWPRQRDAGTALHTQARQGGGGPVDLPYARERKDPQASRAWVWP